MTSLDSYHELNGSCVQNDKQKQFSSRDKRSAYNRTNDGFVERTSGISDAYMYGINVNMTEDLPHTTNGHMTQSDQNSSPSQLHHRSTVTSWNHFDSRSSVSALRMPRLFVENASDVSGHDSACVVDDYTASHPNGDTQEGANKRNCSPDQNLSAESSVSSKISCKGRVKTPVMVKRNGGVSDRQSAQPLTLATNDITSVDSLVNNDSGLCQDISNEGISNSSQLSHSENHSSVLTHTTWQQASPVRNPEPSSSGSKSGRGEFGEESDQGRSPGRQVRSSREYGGESSNRQKFESSSDDIRNRGRRRARESRSIDRNDDADDKRDDGMGSARERHRRGRSASGTRWIRRVLSIEMTLQTTITRDERTMYLTSRTGTRSGTSTGSEGNLLSAELQVSRNGELDDIESTNSIITESQQQRRTSCDGALESSSINSSSSNRFGLPYEERVTSFCVESSTEPTDSNEFTFRDRAILPQQDVASRESSENTESIRDGVCWSLVSESLQEMTRLIDDGSTPEFEPEMNATSEAGKKVITAEGRNYNDNRSDGINECDNSLYASGFSNSDVAINSSFTQSVTSEIRNESTRECVNRVEEAHNLHLVNSSIENRDIPSQHFRIPADIQSEASSEEASAIPANVQNEHCSQNDGLIELQTDTVSNGLENTVSYMNSSAETSGNNVVDNREAQECIAVEEKRNFVSVETGAAIAFTVNDRAEGELSTEPDCVEHEISKTTSEHLQEKESEHVEETIREVSQDVFQSETNIRPSETNIRQNEVSRHEINHTAVSHTVMTQADVRHADMSHTEMSHTEMSHIEMSHEEMSYNVMSEAGMSETAMIEAAMSEAAMSEAGMSEAVMNEAARSEAAVSETAMIEAAMSEAAMSEAAMSEAAMSEAAMSEAAMSEAAMSEAAMSEAAMSEAAMSEAVMSEAAMVYQEQRVLIAEKDFFKSLLGSFGTIIFLLLAAMIFYFINLFVEQDMH